MTGEFPEEKASDAENVSIWWRQFELAINGLSTVTRWSSGLGELPRAMEQVEARWVMINGMLPKWWLRSGERHFANIASHGIGCAPVILKIPTLSRCPSNISITSTGCFEKHQIVKTLPTEISLWSSQILEWAMGHVVPHTWWRHRMETFSALLALCAGNSPVTGEFPAQRAVTRSFDVFFDLHLNNRLNKQSWGWWFATPWCSLWRHCNESVWHCYEKYLSLKIYWSIEWN